MLAFPSFISCFISRDSVIEIFLNVTNVFFSIINHQTKVHCAASYKYGVLVKYIKRICKCYFEFGNFIFQIQKLCLCNIVPLFALFPFRTCEPKLIYGICHDYGPVYDLQWCPANYDDFEKVMDGTRFFFLLQHLNFWLRLDVLFLSLIRS